MPALDIRGIEARLHLSLEAGAAEFSRGFRDRFRREVASLSIAAKVLTDLDAAHHRLAEYRGVRLRRSAQQVMDAVPSLVERDLRA
jgi:hypothetical protein